MHTGDVGQIDCLQSIIGIFSDVMVLKKQGKLPMSDLRTNHAGVVSPLSSTRSHYNYNQHYNASVTHESGF